jgi:phage shock protein E
MRTTRSSASVRFVGAGAALALLLTGCGAAAATDEAFGPGGEEAATSVPVLSPAETVELLENDPDVVLLDVRTAEEVAEGALAGATVIDFQGHDFDWRVGALNPDLTYAIYCRSGNRSAQAAELMRTMGFAHLYDVGAFADLEAAGLPTRP